MTHIPKEKWYAKVIYDNEGIYIFADCSTKAEAEAFVNGFNCAKEISQESDDDPLEDYWTHVDQIEPVEK